MTNARSSQGTDRLPFALVCDRQDALQAELRAEARHQSVRAEVSAYEFSCLLKRLEPQGSPWMTRRLRRVVRSILAHGIRAESMYGQCALAAGVVPPSHVGIAEWVEEFTAAMMSADQAETPMAALAKLQNARNLDLRDASARRAVGRLVSMLQSGLESVGVGLLRAVYRALLDLLRDLADHICSIETAPPPETPGQLVAISPHQANGPPAQFVALPSVGVLAATA